MTSSEFSEELPQRQRPTGERVLRASAPPPPVADAGSPFDSPEELEVQQILASRPALGQNSPPDASEALPRVRTPDERVQRAGGADGLLAFEVQLDDMFCITFAPTAAAARYNAVHGAREAGFYERKGRWPSYIKATRKPLLDKSSLRLLGRRKCWTPEYAAYHP